MNSTDYTFLDDNERRRSLLRDVDSQLSNALKTSDSGLIDLAIVGSMSGHYGWQPCNHLDFDIWAFTSSRQCVDVRATLCGLSQKLKGVFRRYGARYIECRAIDGPYKLVSWGDMPSSVLIHLLVDDEVSFPARSPATRYSWRKYHCLRSSDRLYNLAPKSINITDFLDAKWGLKFCLRACREGVVKFEELNLHTGGIERLSFGHGTPQFLEFCLYAVMTTARNRARLEGHEEPDTLTNLAFSEWYQNIYGGRLIHEIAMLKLDARIRGFSILKGKDLRRPVEDWLSQTRQEFTGE